MLLRTADRAWALRTYLFSLAYLALLFISMPIDGVLISRSPAVMIEIRPWIARHAKRNMTAGLVAGGFAAGDLRALLHRRLPLHRPLMSEHRHIPEPGEPI